MEGGALRTEEFNEFSKQYVMFLHVTTHIEGRKHDGLLSEKGGRGFPSFMVLDQSGAVIGQHSGPRTAAAFEGTVKKSAEFVALRDKAATGDREAMIGYTFARAKMGHFDCAKFEAEMKQFGKLNAKHAEVYNGMLAGFMMDEIQRTAVGERFAEMEAKGLVPTDEAKRPRFYYAIWNYAEYKGDIKLMEKSLGVLRDTWGKDKRYKQFISGLEKKLAKAKAGGSQ